MKTELFIGLTGYANFIINDGDDIEIISVNILKNDEILVTYKYKNEIY